MKRSSKEGSTLVMVLSLVMVGAVLTYAINNARLAQREVMLERAVHVAEAGVEEAAQYIVDRDAFLFSNTTTISGNLNGGRYSGVIRKNGFRSYSITCTGTVGNVSRRIDIDEVFVPTFAQFGWWCHVNGAIWFVPGDTLYGKVHTDDQLRINTSSSQPGPTFEGDLTSLANNYKLRRNNSYETTEYDRYAAEAAGAQFNEGFDLGSDKGDMANVKWAQNKALASNPAYANDPRDDDLPEAQRAQPGYSNDSLGLVSKDDVWIHPAAPNNLKVFSAIMATGVNSNNDGSFGVYNYTSRAPSGDLFIYGSVVQEERGPVGTFNSHGIVSGFFKDDHWDKRFKTAAPPHFPPLEENIVIQGWSEHAAQTTASYPSYP